MPRLYRRYVDDIFCVFSNNIDYLAYLDILNNLHPNISFTYELGGDTLPFLDTEICIKNGNFESWVYRKKTNTNVILNCFSLCPNTWKRGLVACFLHRAWTVCSTRALFLQEVNKLREMFTKNGYHVNFFNKLYKSFMLKKQNIVTNQDISLTSMSSDDESKFYVIVIPFVGKPSLLFKKRLASIFKDCLDVTVRSVFDSFKVKNYFSLKSKTPAYLISNVVYKYTCQCDTGVSYIGETKCHIIKRADEHISSINKFPYTAVGDHIGKCVPCQNALNDGRYSYERFEILDKCKSKLECEVREAFQIMANKPTLNSQLMTNGAAHTLRVFS